MNTFILITRYSGQEFSDPYHSIRDLLSAAADYEPHEIEFAAEIKRTDDGMRTWDDLSDECRRASIQERREAADLRHHNQFYARAS